MPTSRCPASQRRPPNTPRTSPSSPFASVSYLERRNQAHPQQWLARIGINTGPVIGSLVGVQKYVYDLFGPGINLASRMESVSEPMHITLTEETRDLLKDDFLFTSLGEYDIKGFGTKRLYALDGELTDRRI